MPVGLTVVHSRLLISFSRAGGRQRSTPRAPPRVQGWPDAGSMAARRRHWNPWDHWSAWDARAPRGAARLADGTGWRVQWRQPGQLGAGGDAELGEDLVEVVFDGPRADKQLRRDLPVGRPGGGQPGDLQLLRRELGERGRVSPPGGLTTGAQLGPGASGPRGRAEPLEALQRGTQVAAGLAGPPGPPQRLAARQLRAGPVERAAGGGVQP